MNIIKNKREKKKNTRNIEGFINIWEHCEVRKRQSDSIRLEKINFKYSQLLYFHAYAWMVNIVWRFYFEV